MGEQKPDESISLLDLLEVLVRHKLFILGFTAIVGILLFGYVALTTILPTGHPLNLLPNMYKPTAEVLLRPSSGSGSNATLSSFLQGSDLGALAGLLGRQSLGNASAELAVKLLKGETLRDEIAQELDFTGHYRITRNPRSTWRAVFDRAVKTQYDAASNVLTISYTDTDKVFAATVLNSLLTALEKRFTNLSAQRLNETKELVRQQLAETEADLKLAQKALVDYSRAHGIVDIKAQTSSSVDIIAGFRQQLASKELRLAELNASLPPSDPQVKTLQNEISVLHAFIGESEGGFRQFSPVSIPENEAPRVAAEYLNLQYDVQLRQSIYVATRQNWESLLLQQKGSLPEFQILEKAQVPELRSGPNRKQVVIVGGTAAFFFAVLLAFIVEYFQRASYDPRESQKLHQIGLMLHRKKRLPARRLPQ